jgi:hypothetical protein
VQSFYRNRTLEIYAGNELLKKAVIPTNGFINIDAPVRLVTGINDFRLEVPEGCERPSNIEGLNSSDGRCLSVSIRNTYLGEVNHAIEIH